MSTFESAEDVSTPSEPSDEIVARPGRYYRLARYVVSAALVVGGSFFIWDGFVAWPRELQDSRELERQRAHAEVKPHSELDIALNRLIGLTVPPAGVVLLIWTLYNSRGVYRLKGQTLYVPGHPPVPLETIQDIDKRLWEKKRVAYVIYAAPASAGGEARHGGPPGAGRMKLDDFVYNEEKTGQILDRIQEITGLPISDKAMEIDEEVESDEPTQ